MARGPRLAGVAVLLASTAALGQTSPTAQAPPIPPPQMPSGVRTLPDGSQVTPEGVVLPPGHPPIHRTQHGAGSPGLPAGGPGSTMPPVPLANPISMPVVPTCKPGLVRQFDPCGTTECLKKAKKFAACKSGSHWALNKKKCACTKNVEAEE